MELIRQPQDGVRPLLTAVASASKSIDIVIFRLDIKALVSALRDAVNRGVVVRALVAHVSKGSTGSLRRLEQTLLDIGVTVARTADDLVRYHGKMMVIDGRRLHVYGFNYTSADIRGSRSFGFVLTDRALVREALALFDADCERRAYQPGHRHFVVSPFNARPVLARFVRAARRQLLIYDPSVTDPEIVRILVERQRKGVDVRIIGGASRKGPLTAERCPNHRLHVRAIMRDGTHAFVGSQSLRTLELDKRREIGIIVSSKPVVNEMMAVFESDWTSTPTGRAAKATSEAAIEALTATEEAKDALARAKSVAKAKRVAPSHLKKAAAAARKAARAAKAAKRAARDAKAEAARVEDESVRLTAMEAKLSAKEAALAAETASHIAVAAPTRSPS